MTDKDYMKIALELALKGSGNVNPNPMVGAVVVKDDKIIGRGYHKFYGGPHAEVYALDEACDKAQDATIYVTLEPCSHYGKTPPCAKKIIEMGITKCVIASLDPNPLVAGRGIKMMEEAGIEVVTGVLEEEANNINKVFIKYITTKVPYLFLKCAIRLDGKIATKNGSSKWITNGLARKRVQELRHNLMGIIVGINTLIADDPSLTARIEDGIDPFRFVVDPYLKTPLTSKFAKNLDKKSTIITSVKNKEKSTSYTEKDINFIYLEGYDFKMIDILKEIGKMKIDSVLLEGGSYLISKAFSEDIIDGGEIFIAPKILGDSNAIPFISGFNIENIDDGIKLNNTKFNIYGDNISIEFNNRR